MKYRAYGNTYESPTRRVKFIPLKEGDYIDLGNSGTVGVGGAHKIIGFKPAPGRQLGGWLVVLIDEAEKARPIKRRKLEVVA